MSLPTFERFGIARRGHFLLESGHHGSLWLDLELLCVSPERVEPLAAQLAERIHPLHPEGVCGPLNEGAFIALMVAARLGVEFSYSERFERPDSATLFPVGYRVPGRLRSRLRGRRVVIVNDVINAGSAVRGTHADLEACGARPVAIASLLVLGDSARQFAEEHDLELIALEQMPNEIWHPDACPLCRQDIPLEAGEPM